VANGESCSLQAGEIDPRILHNDELPLSVLSAAVRQSYRRRQRTAIMMRSWLRPNDPDTLIEAECSGCHFVYIGMPQHIDYQADRCCSVTDGEQLPLVDPSGTLHGPLRSRHTVVTLRDAEQRALIYLHRYESNRCAARIRKESRSLRASITMRHTIKPGLIVPRRYANELQRAKGFEPVCSVPAFLSTATEAPSTLTSTSTSNAPAAIHHDTIDASVSTDRTHAGGTLSKLGLEAFHAKTSRPV
jgi:hypothetical protein